MDRLAELRQLSSRRERLAVSACDFQVEAFPMLLPHRTKMGMAFVLMLIESALTLAVPFLLKVAIDEHIAQGDTSGLNRIAALAPALILGVPLFDMLFVMYIRHQRGMPVMLGSPDHFALRLRRWRLTTRQTVGLSYGVTAILGSAALLMIGLSGPGAVAVLAAVVAAGVGTGWWLRRIDVGL